MLNKFAVRLFGFIILLTAYCLLRTAPVFAAEFATSYDVLYDIDLNGVTTVTQKIVLKNLTSEYYANQYKLTVGATQITDIKASDSVGALEVSKDLKDNLTIIGVKFNQQVAGLGKTVPWTLSFKSKDFAEKVGKIWEVRAPRISSSSNLESYNLTLVVPESFGPPSSISPLPKSQTTSIGKIFLTFDKAQLTESGISANFGTNQIFDFDLDYHLENNNLVPVLTNIALPPDTAYQDVIFQRIEPKPLNVTIDNDGNYLAWYKLVRSQKLDVKVVGSAKLYTNSKVVKPVLSEDLRKKYTSPDKYWESNNPQITTKLSEILKNSPQSNDEKAKLIFQFVVTHLKYDSSRLQGDIERFGAITALNNPQSAVCMEFTDLFIALSRAAGIPSRELDGYAYTANAKLRPVSLAKDILHAWPEYWSEKKGWVMVDPTWENTTGGVDYFNKLDLNHFAFAIKGFSSSSPVPAGSYKQRLKLNSVPESSDVKVSLSDNDFLGHPQLDIQIEASNPIVAGFPGFIKIKLTNIGNSFYPSVPLNLNVDKLAVLNTNPQVSGVIPAFGTSSFNFDIRTKSLFDDYKDQVNFSVGGQKVSKEVLIKPFILLQTVPLTITVVLSFMVIIYLSVLGFHIYQKRFKRAGKL